jgi:hypothetical protein
MLFVICIYVPTLDKIYLLTYLLGQIDASYQASVHLAKRLQRRRFLEIDNQKQL